MNEKVNKYISSFDYIVYVLSHATKMQLFWLQLMTNDVLSCVLIIIIILLLF
jgi:nitrate/nitrite-specific signal transduction histidine kinase